MELIPLSFFASAGLTCEPAGAKEINIKTHLPSFQILTNMCKTTFIVLDENTFGYTDGDISEPFCKLVVLAVQHIKGGDPALLDKIILAPRERFRIANRQDFDDYRVSISGFDKNPDYVFSR